MIIGSWMALAASGDAIVARVEETRALRSLAHLPEMPTIDADVYRKAADGPQTGLVPVPGHKAKIAYGVTVLDVPIHRMVRAVNDDASKPANTKLSFVEILEGEPCGDRRLVFQFLPISMLSDRYWVVETRRNAALREQSKGSVLEMTWDSRPVSVPEGSASHAYLEQGIPIEFAKGGWWLTALDADHTLAEYWTWTDPGGYVPAGMASSFAAGGIKDTFTSMRNLAARGSTCSR